LALYNTITTITTNKKGTKSRVRYCDAPRPLYGGKPCVGESYQTDVCYVDGFNKCDIDTNEAGISLLLKHLNELELSATNGSLYYDQDGSLLMNCASLFLIRLISFYKKSSDDYTQRLKIKWLRENKNTLYDDYDDDYGKKNDFKIDYTNPINNQHSMINKMSNLSQADSGVYACLVELADSQEIYVARFYSLIVRAANVIYYVESGEPIKLPCNSILLTTLFDNLRQIWYKKEKTGSLIIIANRSIDYRDWSEYETESVHSLLLSDPDESASGTYECVVVDSIGHRAWTTNLIRLVVSRAQQRTLLVDLKILRLIVVLAVLASIALTVRFVKRF
jgi:hypothetical protein